MAYRGSIKDCIFGMISLFDQQGYEFLSIIHNPSGKYYTVKTDAELDSMTTQVSTGNNRLVCRVTKLELVNFATNEQLKLLLDTDNVEN